MAGDDSEYGDFIIANVPTDAARFVAQVRRKDGRFFCMSNDCEVVPEVQRNRLVSVMSSWPTDKANAAMADGQMIADMCSLEKP